MNEKMNDRADTTRQVRRTAWLSLVGGWVTTIVFLSVAAASMYLRGTSHRYWQDEQVQPFKRDCLSALASSPSVAQRFDRFCGHFEIAAETAHDYMSFFAIFSGIGAILGMGHALFAQSVLKFMKQERIHNHQVDASSDRRADASV